MLDNFFYKLTGFTKSPGVNIAVGFILFATGGIEVIHGFTDDVEGITIGAHHGATIFGLFHVLKFIPDLFEGSELIAYTEEHE